jgi:hypothetical protein
MTGFVAAAGAGFSAVCARLGVVLANRASCAAIMRAVMRFIISRIRVAEMFVISDVKLYPTDVRDNGKIPVFKC